jgi:sugar phosphate isomerase/epimerase
VKLCCSSPMVPGATITEKAQRLVDWGYDAIAIFQPLADWTDTVAAELASLENRTGIRPVEFVLIDEIYGNAMSPDAELRQRCRAMYRQAATVCGEIGAVTEIEFQYGPQNPMPLFEPYQQLSTEQESEFIAFYRELLGIVAGTDGRVLLEPLNRYESRYLNLIADNARIVDAVAHPNAGLVPDTFHMSIEESRLGDALKQAGGRIAHVHLGDSNRLLPGRGILDWPEIIGALAEIGYAGYLNLECATGGDPSTTLPETATFLRELIGKVASTPEA